MDRKDMKDVYDAIEMLEELGLPVGMEKLQERKEMETRYLNENVVPEIQSKIQTLVELMHLSFCLVVDHQYGMPVQVRVAEKTKIQEDTKQGALKKVTSQRGKIANAYESPQIKAKLKEFLDSLPKGNAYYKFVITQSYRSMSQLFRTLQSAEMRKYTLPLFEILKLPTTGKMSPAAFKELLEPEQFVKETTKDGTVERIVLWTQSQKVETRYDGTRIKVFEADGVTPVMVDKTKKIKEGQWSLKILCDLMAQKEYFANLHKENQSKK